MNYAGTVPGYCQEGIRKRRAYKVPPAPHGGTVSGVAYYPDPASMYGPTHVGSLPDLIASRSPASPSTGAEPPSPVPNTSQIFQSDKTAFFREKSRLLADPQYRGKHVAIVDGEVAGFGTDRVKLAREVYRTKGYVTMFIGEVSDEERFAEEPSTD